MRFDELPGLIAHVTDPKRGLFYRELYGMQPGDHAISVDSEKEWLALPILEKKHLIARPLKERIFLPLSHLDHLRPSSGTSGRGPLFSPRTYLRGMEYRLKYHDFKRPVISYTVPAIPHWHEEFQLAHGITCGTISFDPKHPAACARLARDAGADALSVFAFHIPLIAPHLVHEGIAGDIRLIEIAGESCSRKLFEFIRATFQNATIIPFYGSSEVEDSPIGMPCRAIDGQEPLALYHGKQSHYMEIRDPDSGEMLKPVSGTEGELIITAYPGEPSSFPLIRFATGDTVRVVDETCPEHGTWSFTLLGRTGMDFLKVPGGILRADEIERVLRTLPEEVSDSFEVLCGETASARGPLLSPLLRVELKKPADLDSLAARISTLLRVSPTMTYSDGVREGRYAPLTCESFEAPIGVKTKRIIRP